MATILHCPRCGRENLTLSSYCDHCLTEIPFETSSKVLICPECHNENTFESDYCYSCHEHLKPGQTLD
ncbi:MAG: zinc ribbon domain-containing protein [Nitrospirae bacterium]|nr:zinc ribbon domain-containing protein [Nitrospirota bacterium]